MSDLSSIRIKVFTVVLVILVLAGMAGATVEVDMATAQTLTQEIENQLSSPTAQSISQHNFWIALQGLIPIAGVFLVFTVSYMTGVAFAAVGKVVGVDGLLLFLGVMTTPFFWLEYIVYSLSVTEGIFVVFAILRRRVRDEAKYFFGSLLVVGGILILAAVLEMTFL